MTIVAAAALACLMAGSGLVLIALHLRQRHVGLNERLQMVPQEQQDPQTRDSVLKAQGFALSSAQARWLNPLIQLGDRLAGTESDREKMQRLLSMAGFHQGYALGLLQSIKWFSGGLLMLLVCGGLLDSESRWGLSGLVAALISLFIGTMLPELLLKWQSNRRGGRLAQALPDALDLMVICAEAGLPLGRVLQVVSREMTLSAPEIASELRYTFAELQVLNDRPRALLNLAERTGVSGIESMVATLIQAERYGTPLAQALRTISDESRKSLVLRLEERAGKLPAQLSVPLMTLILPPIVAMMGAPAMVRIIRILGQ